MFSKKGDNLKNPICITFGHKYDPILQRTTINKCQSIQICNRCHNEIVLSENLHSSIPWKNDSSSSCTLIRQCEECSQVLEQKPVHDPSKYFDFVPDQCKMVRRCNKCSIILEEKIYHPEKAVQWLYTNSVSCEQTKHCNSCNQDLGKRVLHELEWIYTFGTGCEQVRQCKRCNEILETGIIHSIAQWVYTTNDKCEQVCRCERCSTILNKETRHNYNDIIEPDTCKLIRKCIRCGNFEIIPDQHDFKNETTPFNTCLIIRKCLRCGKTETIPIENAKHDYQLVRTEHESGPQGYQATTEYFKCTKCGKEDSKFDWSDSSSRDW